MSEISPKAVAIIVAAIIIASSSFFIFHVSYSTEIPNLKLPKLHPPQIFAHESRLFAGSLLGTSFSFVSNATFTLEGYLYSNANSGHTPLGNRKAYVYVFPWVDEVTTNSNGFYSVTMLHYGSYTVGYTVQNYSEPTASFSIIQGNSIWQNITLSPANFYKTTGKTVATNGSTISNVLIIFHAFFGNYTTTSGSNGFFSTNLPNAMYISITLKGGYHKFPKPLFFNVSGNSKSLTLTMNKTNQIIYFNVSGYIFNKLGKPVNGASVSDIYLGNGTTVPKTVANATSILNGSYVISVPAGYNIIYAGGAPYLISVVPDAISGLSSPSQIFSNIAFTPHIFVNTTLYNENATLVAKDPFSPTGTGKNGTAAVPTYGIGQVNRFLRGNYSAVNYGIGVPLSTPSIIDLLIQNTNESHSPLIDYPVLVLSNITGTNYFVTVFTNSSGFAKVPVFYQGTYKIVIFIPGFNSGNITVNPGHVDHVSFLPLNGQFFTVSGYVHNKIDNLPLSSYTIFNNLSGVFPVNFSYYAGNSAGFYSFEVFYDTHFPFLTTKNVSEQFIIQVKYAGFSSNSLTIDMTKDGNLTNNNISLSPVITIGNIVNGQSIRMWNNVTSGVPGINHINVTENLTNSYTDKISITHNSITAPFLLNITVNSSTINVPDLPLDIYLGVNGVVYNATVISNASGVIQMDLFYSGLYYLQFFGITYETPNHSYSFSNTVHNQVVYINQRQHRTVTIKLENLFALSHPTAPENISVADNAPVISNSNLPVPITSGFNNPSFGTEFNYTLSQGNYYFIYAATGFVKKAFYFFNNVSSLVSSDSINVQGYGIVFQTSTPLAYELWVNSSYKSSTNYNINIENSIIPTGFHSLNISIIDPFLSYGIYVNVSRGSPSPIFFWNFTSADPVEYVWYNLSSNVTRDIVTQETEKGSTIYFTNTTFKAAAGYIYKFAFNISQPNIEYNLSKGTEVLFVQLNAGYILPSKANNLSIDPLFYSGTTITISVSTPVSSSTLTLNELPLTLTLWMYATQINHQHKGE